MTEAAALNIFEITIQRKAGDAWPVVVEYRASGDLPVRKVGRLALDQALLLRQVTPQEYGRALGEALFDDALKMAFTSALKIAGDDLRVLLFVEDEGLRSLRWERLCAPLDGGWALLALEQRTPFSLYLPSATDRRFPPIGRRDLRALVVAYSPPEENDWSLAPFDVSEAAAGVCAALGDIPHHVLALNADVPGAVGPPTLDKLAHQITAQPITMLHFICHGRRKGADEILLYLADDRGQVAPVTASRLIERLRKLRGARGLPHFAFLSTCESAAPEAAGALDGLAQRLVRELGMPAVLAMTETFSVETANALAVAFYPRLRAHGQPDLALVEATAGLAERHDITVPALYSRLGGRALFSDSLDRALTNAEIEFGLARMEELLPERAPVLLDSLAGYAAVLRGVSGADPATLSADARQERDATLAGVNALCEEALDLSFNGLALGHEPPAYDSHCPFQGLTAFTYARRAFFFGREVLTDDLQARLTEHNFLAVLGPSGSGKSSLVLAGLLPALADRHTALAFAYMTPGGDPLAQFDQTLKSPRLLAPPLENDHPPTEPTPILVVDQFEELFTLTHPRDRQAFVDRLLSLVETQLVVLTMRADFWGECASYPALKETMLAHQELIPPMDEGELRSAMEQQAGAVGLRFEADLTNTLLDDVRDEPGAMPLLQHALLELWKRRHGRWLKAEEYRALGGVRQAIARTADGVYEAASADDRKRIRDIFLRLTRMDEDVALGEERRDTRHRVTFEELTPADEETDPTRELVRRLADARLVVTGVNPASDDEEVEVAHEALIRYWPRLRAWLDEDRDALRLRQAIGRDAREWEEGERDEALLPRWNPRLDEALLLSNRGDLPLSKLERDFLDASLALRDWEAAEKERQQQEKLAAVEKLVAEQRQRAEEQEAAAVKLRKRNLVLMGVGIVAVVLAIIAFVFGVNANQAQATAEAERDRANQQTEEAKRQAGIASVRALVVQADAAPSADIRLLLAIQTMEDVSQINDSPYELQAEVERALHRALAVGPTTILRHENAVNSIDLSADGAELASTAYRSGNEVSFIQLVDIATGEPIPVYPFQDVDRIAFGPRGKLMATASGQDVNVLDAETKDLRFSLRGDEWVTGIFFSPDESLLVAVTEDNFHIWSLALQKKLKTIPHERSLRVRGFFDASGVSFVMSVGSDAQIWSLDGAEIKKIVERKQSRIALSGDGTRLVVSSDQGLEVFDLGSLDVIFRPASASSVRIVAISEEGKRLVTFTGQLDQNPLLWDIESDKPIATLSHPGRVRGILPGRGAHANWLITWSDGDVWLWDINDGSRIDRFAFPQDVKSVALDTLGEQFVIQLEDGSVHLWDGVGGMEMADYRHPGSVDIMRLASDAGVLALGGQNGLGRGVTTIWNVGAVTGDEPAVLPVRGAPIWTANNGLITFLGSGGQLLTYTPSNDGVTLWDVARMQEFVTLEREDDLTADEIVAHSKDGRWWLTFQDDDSLQLQDTLGPTGEGATVLLPDRPDWDAYGGFLVTVSLDGRWIAQWTTIDDGSDVVQLFDVDAGEIYTLPHKGSVNAIIFSPDNRWLATNDGRTRLWRLGPDAPTGYVLDEDWCDISDMPNNLVFSPDSTKLAAVCFPDPVKLWDVASQRLLQVQDDRGVIHQALFSPDGAYLAVLLLGDLKLIMLDANTLEPVGNVMRHDARINALTFGQVGEDLLLATASADKTARVWDARTGVIRSIFDHPNAVNDVAFVPGESRLATATSDGEILIWDLNRKNLLQLACRVAGRNLSRTEWEQYFGLAEREYERMCGQWEAGDGVSTSILDGT